MAISLFDMMPKAVRTAGVIYAVLGMALGAIVITLAHLIPHRHSPEDGGITTGKRTKAMQALFRTGMLITIGIALHDLPEGMAIGAGFNLPDYGVWISLLLMLHNIPEGVAMGVPLSLSGTKKLKVILLCLLAGSPSTLGAVIGHLAGDISKELIGGSIAFAVGAMMMVTLQDLIPQSIQLRRSWSVWASIASGVLFGSALLFIPH